MASLHQEANRRVTQAFRPKTRRCYDLLFRNFVGFCICTKVALHHLNLVIILAYLEFLVKNKVSYHMLANNLSALKANCIMYGLDHSLIDHQKVKYFMKSVKINRPLVVVPRNIMSIHMLKKLIKMCDQVPCGSVFKAVFLIAFFGFLRISNIAPHSASSFDSSRNLTLNDITISDKFKNCTEVDENHSIQE